MPRAFAVDNVDRFVDELKELLRIPSASTEPDRVPDIERAAWWLADNLRQIGCANVAVMPTSGYPVVYDDWPGAGPERPTVPVYGHYDVVPAAREDGWDTDPFDPFDPVVKDGRVWARGATDDKGQFSIHAKALESWLAAGGAPVNIKFLLEGEEEVASPNLHAFLTAHAELLRADVCVVSDSSMPSVDRPMITHSLGGIVDLEIHVGGPKDDLHSGFYGGAVRDPALALVEILASLHNPDHSVAVPGFYDDVATLSERERAEIAKTDMSEAELLDATGVPAPWGEAAFTIRERVSARPTLEINGLLSGWAGPSAKTIIPATAMAKITCRLVGNQNPPEVQARVRDHVLAVAPPGVTVELHLGTTGEPALIDFALPEMQAAVRAYERGWGATPTFTRGGGSIPIVADIHRLMGVPVVMTGYGLDTDGLHGTNEHFSLDMFRRGIETAIIYLEELAKLPR